MAIAAGAPANAAPGCADHWGVALDRDSFAHNGASRTFPAATLAAFRTRIEALVKGAIADGCKSGRVKPALAKGVSKVTVFSASGATEPHLYPTGRRTLALEYVFAEENLRPPSRKEILDGAVCWTAPKSRQCAESEGD
jgi:hypothetical protein